MSRDEMIRELLGEPGELPAELRVAARAAFATATDAELRELADCVARGEEADGRAEQLGELSGRRRLAGLARKARETTRGAGPPRSR